MNRNVLLLGLLVAAGGCAWDENLIIENLRGTVRLPVAAATRTIVVDGAEQSVTDPKLIGPVYLGLFPSILEANVIERYPHPEVGPQYIPDVPGNTYPYGGTTVSDVRYACLNFLVCKVASGRYTSYDEMVEWFDFIGQPITDLTGVPVEDGAYIQQTCFDILNVTSDEEVRLLADDRDGDGALTEADVDWQLDGDSYVAEFELRQQDYYWNVDQEGCTPGEDCEGFSLWGWMDSPSTTSYQFSTCDPEIGYVNNWYNSQFQGGASYLDTLNFPALYISDGDWTASEGYRWDDINATPELVLDFEVQ